MKYNCQVTISKPITEVVALFIEPKNAFKWMEGLTQLDLVEGELGQVGSKSKVVFKMGKRIIKMNEQILENNLPSNIKFEYKSPGYYNTVNHHFSDNGDHTTTHIAESYFKFDSWGMKFIALIMPSLFKKQTLKYSNAFKKFAENYE